VARKLSPEWRSAISRGVRWRNSLKRICPSDLADLGGGWRVSERMQPFAAAGTADTVEIVEAKGGFDHITPLQLIIAQDVGRAGAVLRACVTAFLAKDTPDLELASRIASLIGTRRQGLQALGLSPDREIDSVRFEYARAIEAQRARDRDKAAQPDARVVPDQDRAAGRNLGGE
jgi:hypothetical protein